jgi:hypothetical protein
MCKNQTKIFRNTLWFYKTAGTREEEKNTREGEVEVTKRDAEGAALDV